MPSENGNRPRGMRGARKRRPPVYARPTGDNLLSRTRFSQRSVTRVHTHTPVYGVTSARSVGEFMSTRRASEQAPAEYVRIKTRPHTHTNIVFMYYIFTGRRDQYFLIYCPIPFFFPSTHRLPAAVAHVPSVCVSRLAAPRRRRAVRYLRRPSLLAPRGF